jgi:hypothetical protein
MDQSSNGNGDRHGPAVPKPEQALVMTPELAAELLKEWKRARRRGASDDAFCEEWNREHPGGVFIALFQRGVALYPRMLSDLQSAANFEKNRAKRRGQ